MSAPQRGAGKRGKREAKKQSSKTYWPSRHLSWILKRKTYRWTTVNFDIAFHILVKFLISLEENCLTNGRVLVFEIKHHANLSCKFPHEFQDFSFWHLSPSLNVERIFPLSSRKLSAADLFEAKGNDLNN